MYVQHVHPNYLHVFLMMMKMMMLCLGSARAFNWSFSLICLAHAQLPNLELSDER